MEIKFCKVSHLSPPQQLLMGKPPRTWPSPLVGEEWNKVPTSIALAILPSETPGHCLLRSFGLHTGYFQVLKNRRACLQTHWLRYADCLLAVREEQQKAGPWLPGERARSCMAFPVPHV